jgi:hypothetical protein
MSPKSVQFSREVKGRTRQQFIMAVLAVGLKFMMLAAVPVQAAWTFKGEAELATPFPKDHPAAAYPEYKIYDAQNNPVRVPQEDWTGAVTRVANDPGWAKWLMTEKAEVDEWMQKRQDKVEWIAGWSHDGESPKDASRVIPDPDEPILGTYSLQSKTDSKILVTPKLHGWWVNYFRQRHVEKMLEAARLYRLTGEKKYADWAARQLDFYADNYLKWPLDNPIHKNHSESRLMAQPLDDAIILINFVLTARTLGDYVPPTRNQKWVSALFMPEATLIQQSGQQIQNMSCWQRSAAGITALYCKDDALWKEVLDAPYGIHDQVARGVTSDYLWYEQSLGYNDYVVAALSPVFTYAQMAGRGADLQEDMATIENLMLTPYAMRFVTGRWPIPADGGKDGVADAYVLNDIATLFPTKVGIYNLAHAKNWTALLDPPDPVNVAPQPPAMPPVISRNFDCSRMAVIRSGPWQVFLHYGQLTHFHAEPDVLNFEAFYQDTDVTHNPSKFLYGSEMFPKYMKTPVCHNVPLIDGTGQAEVSPGQLDSFSTASVAVSEPQYQTKARASRAMTIDGDALQDTVQVATSDGSTHALGFLLHVNGKVVHLPANFVVEPNPERIQASTAFQYWRNASRATFHDRATFAVKYEAMTLQIDFALPGDFTIWHATVPDLPTRTREAFYLQTQGKAATLITTLRPAPPIATN